MTIAANNKVENHFFAKIRDLTPPSARQAVKVLFAPVSGHSEVSAFCASLLSKTELQQMQRMGDAGLRALFAQRRAFRRFCAATAQDSCQPLSAIVFEQTDKGRPYLGDAPELWFSFSSCRFGMLGAWSSSCGVGVDIEDRTREVEVLALARQFFSAAEAAAIAAVSRPSRLQTFYQLWSLKEAALKSIGQGMPFGLDAFEFELQPSARFVDTPAAYGGSEQFCAHEIALTNMSSALVTRDAAVATSGR